MAGTRNVKQYTNISKPLILLLKFVTKQYSIGIEDTVKLHTGIGEVADW